MFADVTNVLLQVVKLDGGSIAEKVESAMAGHQVQLSLGEQIKLREAVIETYRRLAERCKNELDTKMSDLRFVHRQLKELSEQIESYEQQLAQERQEAKENYEENLNEIFVSPTPRELGEDDEIYITLAFKWKTEAELRWDLFKNDFETWLEENRTDEGNDYAKAAEIIFNEVLAQKAALDQEVSGKVDIISDILMEAYNNANGKVEALEAEIGPLKERADSDLPEDELDLTRIPVGETFFYGTDSFSPELENFANSGLSYDDYYGELQTHISEYQEKAKVLLESINDLKDRHEDFYASIETDVENVVFYLDLLKKLGENYHALYGDAVWQIHNDPEKVDISPNYNNCPQINPYYDEAGEEYRVDGFVEAIESENLPEEVYDPDVSATEVADVLAVTRPTGCLTRLIPCISIL